MSLLWAAEEGHEAVVKLLQSIESSQLVPHTLLGDKSRSGLLKQEYSRCVVSLPGINQQDTSYIFLVSIELIIISRRGADLGDFRIG